VGVAILATFAALGIKRVRDSRKMARYMHDRRTERLKDIDMSEEEFMEVLQIRRSQKNQNHNNNNFNSNYNNRYDHYDHNNSANRKNISRGRKDHRM
ncbi:MAG: hypothetical protein IJ803_10230, partial [Oribacterium sp.]|nr:hypothetical protein [Oribacterium sp.]